MSRVHLALTAGLVVGSAALAGGKRVVIEDVPRYEVVDPLFECVRVALSHRGEAYSPAYIQGISGAAFRIGGPCPCAPTCAYAMTTIELVRLLGYEAEDMSLAGREQDAAEVARVVVRVKEEVRAGRPAPVWHAFTFAEWDVVCGFDDETGKFLGRGSYAGREDYAEADQDRTAKCTDICPSGGALIIGKKVREFDARDAELDALEEALRHAHSPRDRFLDEVTDRPIAWRFRRGLAAYDWWIRDFGQTDKVPYNGDSYCVGVYRSTHRAAAAFLREIAPKYPTARDHLERAETAFVREADALDGCAKLEGISWETKKERNPKRNADMVKLLAQARDGYAQGMDELEKALGAIEPERVPRSRQPRPVRRKDGRVWIAGAKKLAFDKGPRRNCTLAGALTEALAAAGHPLEYHEIMGFTGLAFRVRWCNDETKTKWCPSVAIGEMPDEHAALARLTGWALPVEWTDADKRDTAKLRARIVAEIDAGRPVLTYPEVWNMAVVYGYEDGGKTLLVNDYKATQLPATLPVEKLGPMQIWLGEYRTPPKLRDAVVAALRTAATNWRHEKHDGGLEGREYWYGDAAFAAWIGDLRQYDRLSQDARKGLQNIHPWNYTSLVDARRAAVAFLKEWGILLDGEAREAVDRARESYEKEVKVLEPFEADRLTGGAKPDWSEAARERVVEALAEARKLESQAIAALAMVLK